MPPWVQSILLSLLQWLAMTLLKDLESAPSRNAMANMLRVFNQHVQNLAATQSGRFAPIEEELASVFGAASTVLANALEVKGP